MEDKLRRNWRFLDRTLVVLVGEAVGLTLLAHLIPGLGLTSFAAAFAFVVVLGIANALLWPILTRSTLRFLTYTFGLGVLLLNMMLIWLTGTLLPGTNVEGFALVLTAIALTAINMVFASLLTNNDDAWYYRNILQREIKKTARAIRTERKGTIFLEIDGLAESVLREAVNKGYLPTLAKWLESGSHSIASWATSRAALHSKRICWVEYVTKRGN